MIAIILIPFAALSYSIIVGLFVIIYYALYYALIELSGFDKEVLVPAVAAAGLVFAYWFSNLTKAHYDSKTAKQSKKKEIYNTIIRMLLESYSAIDPVTRKFSKESAMKLNEIWQTLILWADDETIQEFESVSSDSNIGSDEYLESVKRFLILLRTEAGNGKSEKISIRVISEIIKKSQGPSA